MSAQFPHTPMPGAFADGAPPAGAAMPRGAGGQTGRTQVELDIDHGVGASPRPPGSASGGGGAGYGPYPPEHGQPMPHPRMPLPAPMRKVVEGLRGLSTRTAVRLRYVGYFLTIIIGSATTHWAMSTAGAWASGGWFMFGVSVLMAVTGAVGTWFYVNHRNEILEQFKHYLFGICLIPGSALAVINRLAQGVFDSPTAQQDAFLSATASALPLLVFITVVIPAALFVKMIAGIRHIHRTRLDDQEAMNTYTRTDGLMR